MLWFAPTPGVGDVGMIGQGTFTGAPAAADGETYDTTVIGYELDPDGTALGAPTTLVEGRLPTADFEAVSSDADVELGYRLGDVVTLVPGGLEITIVGVAEDTQLNVSPTLFASYDTYVEAIRTRNPDAGTPLPNVLAVSPADGVSPDELVVSINEQSLDLDALTRDEAAAKTPGVAQVQQSFQVIFLLYGLVVPLRDRAVLPDHHVPEGELAHAAASDRRAGLALVSSLLIQVVIIVGAGCAVGTLLYLPVTGRKLGGIPLRFETRSGRLLVAVPDGARRAQLARRGPPGAAHRPDRGHYRVGGRTMKLALQGAPAPARPVRHRQRSSSR